MIADRKAHWIVVEGEVVLIHLDGSPAYFARVDRIEQDVKDGWWKLEFQLLTLPTERLTWVIDESHMAGERFMIGKTLIWIEQVPPINFGEKGHVEVDKLDREPLRTSAKVISIGTRRREAIGPSCR